MNSDLTMTVASASIVCSQEHVLVYVAVTNSQPNGSVYTAWNKAGWGSVMSNAYGWLITFGSVTLMLSRSIWFEAIFVSFSIISYCYYRWRRIWNWYGGLVQQLSCVWYVSEYNHRCVYWDYALCYADNLLAIVSALLFFNVKYRHGSAFGTLARIIPGRGL